MTTDNMKFWEKVKTPPPDALKEIMGGRLKGKSDINPQWRIEVMTEHFGPCGIGWKFEIVKETFKEGGNGEVAVFVEIKLFIKDDKGEWSDPIPGTGGSMFVEKESRGLYTSDEALKMATTDALSVAMKMLGVAAEVYKGNMDGSKYQKTEEKPEDQEKVMKAMTDLLKRCDDDTKSSKWWTSNANKIAKLPAVKQKEITATFQKHRSQFFRTCNVDPEKPEQVLKTKCEKCGGKEKCKEYKIK